MDPLKQVMGTIQGLLPQAAVPAPPAVQPATPVPAPAAPTPAPAPANLEVEELRRKVANLETRLDEAKKWGEKLHAFVLNLAAEVEVLKQARNGSAPVNPSATAPATPTPAPDPASMFGLPATPAAMFTPQPPITGASTPDPAAMFGPTN